MDVKLGVPLVDVKDPAVSFAKSVRAIAGTLNKLQIPALTFRGTASTAQLRHQPMMLPRNLVLHAKEKEDGFFHNPFLDYHSHLNLMLAFHIFFSSAF